MKKSAEKKGGVAPRSTLAIKGKSRPPRVEKLRGDEVPPPDAPTAKNPSP